MARVLTGMQASGNPHIGNYFGMMKPALDSQNSLDNENFYFIADLHSFTSQKDKKIFAENQKRCVLDWLALGMDPERSYFYRQSDLAGIHAEMAWYLNCFMPMGLLERAHSYKDKKARGLDTNVGLFTYPVLMAADMLLYDAEVIPVGKDQIQHVEMARDIAQKVNNFFDQEFFILPSAQVKESIMTIPGLDGQKMSKSYGNTISIFGTEKEIRKQVMKIETQTVELGDPIDPEKCNIFAFHKLFNNPNLENLRESYLTGGIGFGESKQQLFALIWDYFAEARTERVKLENDEMYVNQILKKGAEKARKIAGRKLEKMRKKLGMSERGILG